jgi:hypothetical protein
MKHQSKLTSRQSEQEQQISHQESQQHSAQEFATVEAMLRHDAVQTSVPPNIAHRLQKSTGQVSPSGRSWWQRWFGS